MTNTTPTPAIQACPRLQGCGFFKKYQDIQNDSCRAFIRVYCQGEKQSICKRLEYSHEHGHPPVDEMLPSGQIFHVRPEDIARPQKATAQTTPPVALPPKSSKPWWRFWS